MSSLDDIAKDEISRLRNKSRQVYLQQREAQQIQSFEGKLEDEAILLEDESNTEYQRQFEYRKEILELAKQRREISETTLDDDYRPPDLNDLDNTSEKERKWRTLSQRYQESENSHKSLKKDDSELKMWEDTQIDRMKKPRNLESESGSRSKNIRNDISEFLNEKLLDDDTRRSVVTSVLEETRKSSGKTRTQTIAESERIAKAKREKDMETVRESLPVFKFRETLLSMLKENQIIIIEGETGSGKTTQIPQYLVEGGYCADGKKVGVTQPRRVAAMSVARRVSEESNCVLGHEVGYSIRFEECTSRRTRLVYMTDGMLFRAFMSEPDLSSYSVIMLDEAHERTLHTDILFGLLKDICRYREDMKLIVASATLDASKFALYFEGAPVLKIPGRRFEVVVHYTKQPEPDYLEATVVTVLNIHMREAQGDILVFFTGQEEIESAMEMLKERTSGLGTKMAELIVLPLYANLPADLQAKVFEETPVGARKVVLSTNIAETSLTIDGIRYVIDPGFAKQNCYNPRSGMDSLVISPISRASCDQRAGRAGRTAPGKCYRLFTKWSFLNELPANTMPEIQRTNLGNVVLLLKSLGIDDLVHFDFMDPPPAETLMKALEELYALGALNDKGELTKLGRRMAEFPLNPMLSKVLVASAKHLCTKEALTICSMLSVSSTIFFEPKDRKVQATASRDSLTSIHGDHFLLMNTFDAWEESGHNRQWCFDNFVLYRSMVRARDIRDQLQGICERVNLDCNLSARSGMNSSKWEQNVLKTISSGFFFNAAKLDRGGGYSLVKNGKSVQLHPSSVLHPKSSENPPAAWVIFHECVSTSQDYMRYCVGIEPEWLVEIAPHFHSGLKTLLEEKNKKMPRRIR